MFSYSLKDFAISLKRKDCVEFFYLLYVSEFLVYLCFCKIFLLSKVLTVDMLFFFYWHFKNFTPLLTLFSPCIIFDKKSALICILFFYIFPLSFFFWLLWRFSCFHWVLSNLVMICFSVALFLVFFLCIGFIDCPVWALLFLLNSLFSCFFFCISGHLLSYLTFKYWWS